MLGFIFLLTARTGNINYLIGCVFLALSFYAYGAAYVAAPVFLVCATIILLVSKRIKTKTIIFGTLLFVLLITPAVLFVLTNTFKWETIKLGLMTIPRLPARPRYEAVTAVFNAQSIQPILHNGYKLFKLLLFQTDGQVFNVVEPYGYLYTITFPLAVLGVILFFSIWSSRHSPEQWMLLSCLVAACMVGLIESAEINTMCLIFIPLIMFVAFSIAWIGKHSRIVFIASILALLVGFVLFTRAYHSETYRENSAIRFYPGLLTAVDFARQAGTASDPICMTDKVSMPYMFVEFLGQADPRQYLSTIKYVNPKAEFRVVQSMDRYTFGLKNCANLSRTIYITRYDENLPVDNKNYSMNRFDHFLVYIPNP
jgi:hypothetical protein